MPPPQPPAEPTIIRSTTPDPTLTEVVPQSTVNLLKTPTIAARPEDFSAAPPGAAPPEAAPTAGWAAPAAVPLSFGATQGPGSAPPFGSASGPGSAPPGGTFQPPTPYPPIGGGPRPRSSSRGWLIAGVVFVLVAALATTAVLLLQRSDDTAADQAVIGSTVQVSTAAPPESAAPPQSAPSVQIQSKAREAPESTPGKITPSAGASGSGPTPAPAPPPAAADPMGGPRLDIACGDGYIVQVASELDTAAFTNRVAQLRAAGTLPPGTQWAQTSTSCSLFTTQSNVLVLYAGPFVSQYDACPARLASPPDAFIKSTNPQNVGQYVSCLCPAVVSTLPTINTVDQQNVWVGELQRVLGSKLDYDVGSINADPAAGNPGKWGTYTTDTAAAVGRFQRDNGLPITDQVDQATWSALQRNSC